MDARGRHLGGVLEAAYHLVSRGLGHPQILPAFQAVLLTAGWGHPEPQPSVPGAASLSPRESVHCVLPHKETEHWPFPWSPSTAPPAPSSHTWSFWGSHSLHPFGCPQPLGRVTPRSSSQDPVVGTGAGAGRLALCLTVGVGRLSSCWGWGDWQTGCPAPSRAQVQEVQLRQLLHTIGGRLQPWLWGSRECRSPQVGEPRCACRAHTWDVDRRGRHLGSRAPGLGGQTTLGEAVHSSLIPHLIALSWVSGTQEWQVGFILCASSP